MIGKGNFFDLISRTARDVNDPELSEGEILKNYGNREEKYHSLIKKSRD